MSQKIKEFIRQNQGKLFIIAFSYFVMDLLSLLPYLNIVFTTRNKIFAMVFILTIILKLRTKAFLLVGFVSIVFSIIALLVSRDDVAENLGNLLYLVLGAVLIINLPPFFKDLKRK